MNLTGLFEVQRKLDAEIEKKHPTLPGEDRLAKRILALQVELGECANEQRSWKFWSTDQEPRRSVYKPHYEKEAHGPIMRWHDPLLEEFVDCLHFILSIGLEIGCTPVACDVSAKTDDVNKQFRGLNFEIAMFDHRRDFHNYHNVLKAFKGLGEMLNFTWEQIETAYLEKNAINHQRQVEGY